MFKSVKILICLLMCVSLLIQRFSAPPVLAVQVSSEAPDHLRLLIQSDGQLLAEVDDSPVSDTVSDTEYSSCYAMVDSLAGDAIVAWGTQLRWTEATDQMRLRGSPYYSYVPTDAPGPTQSTDDPQRFAFGEGEWLAGSQSQPDHEAAVDLWEIRWQWPDDQLELIQTISHQPGQWCFDIRWQLFNRGSEPVRDLDLIHGGDTQLCGPDVPSTSENVRVTWDHEHDRLMVWPDRVWDDGMMILSSGHQSLDHQDDEHGDSPDQRPDHYQSLAASQLQTVVRDPRLVSDTTWSQSCDQAVLLQWTLDELDPGDCWSVSCCQRCTPAGQIHLIGPEPRSAYPGDAVVMDYEMLYRGQTLAVPEFTYDLQSQSEWSWTLDMDDKVVFLDEENIGLSQFIHLSTTVPDTAEVDTLERIELEVRPDDNPYLFSRAYGELLVTGSRDVPSVTPMPSTTPSVIPENSQGDDETDSSDQRHESTADDPISASSEPSNIVVPDTSVTTERLEAVFTDEGSSAVETKVENPSTGPAAIDMNRSLMISLLSGLAVFMILLAFYLITIRIFRKK